MPQSGRSREVAAHATMEEGITSPSTSPSSVMEMIGERHASEFFKDQQEKSSTVTDGGDSSTGKVKGPDPPPAASALMSCIFYTCCSTLMVLANKSLASYLDVMAPMSLLCMQNFVAVVLVETCKALGLVSYADFDRTLAWKWLPVNVCFIMMLSTSFITMRYLSVPMITVFKQFANLLTVSGEFYLFGKEVSRGVVGAFAVMISGAILAAQNDVAFSFPGYCWQFANCVATSAYVLYLKFATTNIKLSKFGMAFYNNLLSLPFLILLAIANGEHRTLRTAYEAGHLSAYFFAFNAFAGSVGFLLNLASVWCVSATSATTYAAVGTMSEIPVTILGVFLFRSPISVDMAKYIALSFTGGFLYSYEMTRKK